jgi:hypothetical protein
MFAAVPREATELMMRLLNKTVRSGCQTYFFDEVDRPMFSRDFFVKHVVILITITDVAPIRVAFSQFRTDWR